MIDKKAQKILESQELVTVGFSLGKDSLACAAICKEVGVRFIPFYFYYVPDLGFVDEAIKMYEDFFKTEIIQLPHPQLFDNLRRQDFMDAEQADKVAEIDWGTFDFRELMEIHFDDEGIEESLYDVVGMRSAESFNRRKYFERFGSVRDDDPNDLKLYPIWHWKKADVFNYLKKHKVPLTNDYNIWDRSFDGLKYQFLFGVKQNYPKDWLHLKSYFPLLETELLRYEFNLEYFK